MLAEQIAKVILDTCEKELNQTIGFMLTEDEAKLFAKAIASKLMVDEQGIIKVREE